MYSLYYLISIKYTSTDRKSACLSFFSDKAHYYYFRSTNNLNPNIDRLIKHRTLTANAERQLAVCRSSFRSLCLFVCTFGLPLDKLHVKNMYRICPKYIIIYYGIN